jgi:hypothetical protein
MEQAYAVAGQPLDTPTAIVVPPTIEITSLEEIATDALALSNDGVIGDDSNSGEPVSYESRAQMHAEMQQQLYEPVKQDDIASVQEPEIVEFVSLALSRPTPKSPRPSFSSYPIHRNMTRERSEIMLRNQSKMRSNSGKVPYLVRERDSKTHALSILLPTGRFIHHLITSRDDGSFTVNRHLVDAITFDEVVSQIMIHTTDLPTFAIAVLEGIEEEEA